MNKTIHRNPIVDGRGPVIQVRIRGKDDVVSIAAIVSTGLERTIVSDAVLTCVCGEGVNVHPTVDVIFKDGLAFVDLPVNVATTPSGASAVLGRDILNRCLLHYDGPAKEWTLEVHGAVPSATHAPDGFFADGAYGSRCDMTPMGDEQ